MLSQSGSQPSSISNFLARSLRPIVGRYRDTKRVKQINKDVERILPHLASHQFSAEDIVVDLGANRGDFSIWSQSKGASVIGFEPHPMAFDYFARRTRKKQRITRNQAAVSAHTYIGNIKVHPNASQDQLGFSIRATITENKKDFQKFEDCLVIDFKTIVAGLGKIKVLKVDIEGSEMDIWPTIESNFEKIDFLLLEIHDQLNQNLRVEVEAFIKANNLQSRWSADWV